MNQQVTRELVKAILTSPNGLKWSTQGLGMLRTYLSQEVRLHVWDSILKVPYASPLHDHPWHLDSHIVAGEVRQYRYRLVSDAEGTLRFKAGSPHSNFLSLYNRAKIKCGEDACTVTAPEKVWLQQQELERYTAGQSYRQTKDEIHESLPKDGTVTLVTRTFTADRDHASVYWSGDGGFVSAEPRAATEQEVFLVTQRALRLWFEQ